MGAFISAIVASKLKSVQALILLDGAAKASEHQRGIVQPSLGRISREFTSKEHYVEEIKKIYTNLGVEWNDVLQETVEYEVGACQGTTGKINQRNLVLLLILIASLHLVQKRFVSQIECPVLLVYAEGNIGSMPPLFYITDYEETQAIHKEHRNSRIGLQSLHDGI